MCFSRTNVEAKSDAGGDDEAGADNDGTEVDSVDALDPKDEDETWRNLPHVATESFLNKVSSDVLK